MEKTLFQENGDVGETKSAAIETIPTLIEDIYNSSKLLFNKTVKNFISSEEAEQWAELNGIRIKIRHRAGSFVGDNLINDKNGHRDDSVRYKEITW